MKLTFSLHPSMWRGEGKEPPTDPIMYDVRGLPPGHEEVRIRLKPKGWTIETRNAESGAWIAELDETDPTTDKAKAYPTADAALAALTAAFANRPTTRT
ncbi:MAG TPA: hypothetical protein VN461_09040 [Vicinamibacteria bacterium]|jgi:hypothetical protein|nr:hypothetical protein [Vicinamibacteria bacterium]